MAIFYRPFHTFKNYKIKTYKFNSQKVCARYIIITGQLVGLQRRADLRLRLVQPERGRHSRAPISGSGLGHLSWSRHCCLCCGGSFSWSRHCCLCWGGSFSCRLSLRCLILLLFLLLLEFLSRGLLSCCWLLLSFVSRIILLSWLRLYLLVVLDLSLLLSLGWGQRLHGL